MEGPSVRCAMRFSREPSMTHKLAIGVLALLALSSAIAAEPKKPYQAKAREIYAKIISIPSQKGNDQVPEVAGYLANEFLAAGFPVDDVHMIPFAGKDDNTACLV